MTGDITLYGLAKRRDHTEPNWSAFVWKTKVDLAILGVPYTSVDKSFHQIKYELPEVFGTPTVMVPTIKVGEEYITDSWTIAEWLESKYATPEKSLFGSAEGKAFARFTEIWADTTLAAELRPLVMPLVYSVLDDESAAYFLRTKFGDDKPRLLSLRDKLSDPEYVAAHWASVRKQIKTVESLLAKHKAAGKKLWLTGEAPTHADANVFGWYAFTRLSEDFREGWEHEDLPLVGEWIKNITELLGEEKLIGA
ncbi:hypothetical protein IAT38_003792 [Cryptococcus sp. DSM 104549]